MLFIYLFIISFFCLGLDSVNSNNTDCIHYFNHNMQQSISCTALQFSKWVRLIDKQLQMIQYLWLRLFCLEI